jgi:ribosomal protein L40E
VIDDEKPLSKIDDLTPKAEKPARRRGARRKAAEEAKPDVAECGACGADLPVEATECGTCGAKFE